MQRFSVTIHGKTYTAANFTGLAYVAGIPDSLESMGDSVLQGVWSTSTSTVNPFDITQTFVLNTPADFNVGDIVMAWSTSSPSWSVGTISGISGSTLTVELIISDGSSSSSWDVFVTRGDRGQEAFGEASRLVTEGGHGQATRRNGITRMFVGRHGYNKELVDEFPDDSPNNTPGAPHFQSFEFPAGKGTMAGGWHYLTTDHAYALESLSPRGYTLTRNAPGSKASCLLQYGTSGFFSPFSGESLVSIGMRPKGQPRQVAVGLYSEAIDIFLENTGSRQRSLVITSGGSELVRHLLPAVTGDADPTSHCLLWFHPSKRIDVYDTTTPHLLDTREPLISFSTEALYAATAGTCVLSPRIYAKDVGPTGTDTIDSFYISQRVTR